jgi:hypothetical protein
MTTALSVEELSALRTGWLAAFAHPAAHHWTGTTRAPATRSRLEETVSCSGCTEDDHHDDHTANWPAIPDPNFAAALEAELADRPPMLAPSAEGFAVVPAT